MQLHHYTQLNKTSEAIQQNETETKKRKKKVLVGRDGWHTYGSVSVEFNDRHVEDMKAKYHGTNTSDVTSLRPKPPSNLGNVDRTKSLAYPGSKHHPYEKHLGSFTLDEFLTANIKYRSVFVAGEWKVRCSPTYDYLCIIPLSFFFICISLSLSLSLSV
jgi:hypothetical protein